MIGGEIRQTLSLVRAFGIAAVSKGEWMHSVLRLFLLSRRQGWGRWNQGLRLAKDVGSLADLRDWRNLSTTLVLERTVSVVMSIAYGDDGSWFFCKESRTLMR